MRIHTVKNAAATFNVPQSTLATWLARIVARHDYKPKLKKLTLLEEQVIIKHIQYLLVYKIL
jgi:hypothetical protein